MLVDLDAGTSLDPRVVGAKAAWLAGGRRARLPILPGFAIPVLAARPAIAAGAAEVAARGSGRARLAALAVGVDPDLVAAARAAAGRLGPRLVVRSSSPLEADGRWAGAFTSYVDIGVDDLPTAIAGCWASALAPDPLDRAARAGLDPEDLAPAVLVQPFVAADAGGTATIDEDGVRLTGVRGSPVPLLQGWEPGVVARIGPDGWVRGDGLRALLGEAALDGLVAVLRRVAATTPATSIEWAVVDGAPVVLQLGRAAAVRATASTPPDLLDDATPMDLTRLARIAAVVRQAPGGLGQALVLPWALGEGPPVANPRATTVAEDIDASDPIDRLAAAVRLADALTEGAWTEPGDRPGTARQRAEAAVAALRGPDPVAAARVLAARPAADPEIAASIRASLDEVVSVIVERGAATDREAAWALGPAAAGWALRDGAPTHGTPARVDPWSPFQAAVILATGERRSGVPSGPGLAVGRLTVADDARRPARSGRRDVVVAARPLPHLAPWLWDAAAVVTTGGGPGAHLFESARALGLPAVSAIGLDDDLSVCLAAAGPPMAIAVDGTRGLVAWTPW